MDELKTSLNESRLALIKGIFKSFEGILTACLTQQMSSDEDWENLLNSCREIYDDFSKSSQLYGLVTRTAVEVVDIIEEGQNDLPNAKSLLEQAKQILAAALHCCATSAEPQNYALGWNPKAYCSMVCGRFAKPEPIGKFATAVMAEAFKLANSLSGLKGGDSHERAADAV